jgi:hypothetical protein
MDWAISKKPQTTLKLVAKDSFNAFKSLNLTNYCVKMVVKY